MCIMNEQVGLRRQLAPGCPLQVDPQASRDPHPTRPENVLLETNTFPQSNKQERVRKTKGPKHANSS